MRNLHFQVSFNTRDELGEKIDKLTVMMSKLVAKDSHERKPFKPQIYKSRGQSRSHDGRAYQTRPNDRNRRYDVMSVENMITLLEIVQAPERRET